MKCLCKLTSSGNRKRLPKKLTCSKSFNLLNVAGIKTARGYGWHVCNLAKENSKMSLL